MKTKLITLLLLISISSFEQENDSLKNRPGQVTFFYPLGTNGFDSPNYMNNVSFNALYGVNGGVNGVEFGGLVNVNLGDVTGCQFGGIANVNLQKTNGIVFAGIANIIKDSSNTLSFAGISNVMGKSAIGLHFAGISNTVNGDFMGGQFGGIVNTINGNFTGAQYAGISNVVHGNFKGLQVAGISNISTGDFTGAQLGLINTARRITGFQMGLINIAETFEKGVPIGLFSFVKNGFHALEISTNESIFANLNFKLGVDEFYTIYKFGFASNNGSNYLTTGFGVGGMYRFNDNLAVSLDISANHTIESTFQPKLDLLNKGEFAVRYHLNNHIGFFAGPSFNVYLTQFDGENTAHSLNVPYVFYEENWWNDNGKTSIWVGGQVGISFIF